MGVTSDLAEFIAKATCEDLPREVVDATKRVILDTLGCMIAATPTEAGRVIVETMKKWGGIGESSIIGDGAKLPTPMAAFANAALANALDADDTLFMTGHSANCCVASALALGEKIKASGRDVITSVAVGFEVSSRVGLSIPHDTVTEDGKVTLASGGGQGWTTFAAVATAAKLLNLTNEETNNAFGIAGYSSPVSTRGLHKQASTRPLAKYAPYHFMGFTGLTAALMAQEGYTGYHDIFDGEAGYWKISGAASCDWGTMTDDLGKKWLITETAFKWFPACRLLSASLDLFYKIVEQETLRAEDIEEVTVRVPFLVRFMQDTTYPANMADAEFSIPYCVAMIARRIRRGPAWFLAETLKDPQTVDFFHKVKIEENQLAYPSVIEEVKEKGRYVRIPTSIEIKSRGTVFKGSCEFTKGDPWTIETRMTDEEIGDKFRDLTSDILSEKKAQEAIRQLFALDSVRDVSRVIPLLT